MRAISGFDRVTDPVFVDGLIDTEVSVSEPVDAWKTDPVRILPSSVVREKVSEVKEMEVATLRTKREDPSLNLLTVLVTQTYSSSTTIGWRMYVPAVEMAIECVSSEACPATKRTLSAHGRFVRAW